MSSTSLKRSSLTGITKYDSMLAGNAFYDPEAHVLIATQTLAANAASVTFSSIPSTFKHLQIRGIVRNASPNTTYNLLYVQFNGDTSANYAWHYLIGAGSSAASSATTSTTSISVGYSMQGGGMANLFDPTIIDVLDYSTTSKYKTTRALAGHEANAVGNGEVGLHSGVWMNTQAVTSLTLFQGTYNLVAGSSFALYGIKG